MNNHLKDIFDYIKYEDKVITCTKYILSGEETSPTILIESAVHASLRLIDGHENEVKIKKLIVKVLYNLSCKIEKHLEK